MFTANVISVEDCPNGRSSCKDCRKAILPNEPRVRTEQRRYCHLNCYHPKYPVTINSVSDVFNKLQRPQNQHALDEWISKWNSQFQPLRLDLIKMGSKPLPTVFSRLHIEIFKFLTHSEICVLVGLTCRLWYQLSWSEELWIDITDRDYPGARPLKNPSAREGYVQILTQACLACNQIPPQEQIRVICPASKRPICATCFQKPGSSVFQVNEYATLLGVSQEYMREAGVPVYSYNSKNWVFSHQADLRIIDFRAKRRSEMLRSLGDITHLFSHEDLLKIKSLNLTRAKYIGVVLKHKFEGEEDLIDLLNFIYSSSEVKGLTLEALVKRNRRRRLKMARDLKKENAGEKIKQL